jgi:LacI family transcriptional regulator
LSPTLIDIARETSTSVSTVSRVLAGGAVAQRISEQTRGRVLEAASRLGYRPNLLARSLRTRKTHAVALLVSDIANPFFSQIASLVEQSLHKHGYSLVLCNSGEDPDREDEYLNLLPRKGIDALILVPMARGRKAVTASLPKNLPLVVLDRPIPGIAACVSSDQEQAAAALSDALARAGVRKIALICGPQVIFTHRRRTEIVSHRFEIVAKFEGSAQVESGRAAGAKLDGAHPGRRRLHEQPARTGLSRIAGAQRDAADRRHLRRRADDAPPARADRLLRAGHSAPGRGVRAAVARAASGTQPRARTHSFAHARRHQPGL